MGMSWEISGSSCYNSRSDLGKDRSSEKGVHHLFDEMIESDWRSPSRVLEVTIHRAYYPITEKVLHLLFDPFGAVEHVHLLGGLDPVFAQVIFSSKYDAVEAFGDLHGRNIYDGSCQLDIQYGVPSELHVPVVMSNGNTVESSSLPLFPSVTTALSTLDDICSEKSPLEAVAIGEHAADTTTAAGCSGSDVMDHNIAIAFQVFAASTITMDQVPDAVRDAAAAPTIDIYHNDINVDAPTHCSMRFLDSGIGIYEPVNDPGTALTLTKPGIPTFNIMHPSSSLLLLANQSAHHFSDNMPVLMKWVKPQPCPTRTHWELASGEADLRPMPWPSFFITSRWPAAWCCALCREAPDLVETQQQCRSLCLIDLFGMYLPLDVLEDHTFILWPPSAKRVTCQAWPPPLLPMLMHYRVVLQSRPWPFSGINGLQINFNRKVQGPLEPRDMQMDCGLSWYVLVYYFEILQVCSSVRPVKKFIEKHLADFSLWYKVKVKIRPTRTLSQEDTIILLAVYHEVVFMLKLGNLTPCQVKLGVLELNVMPLCTLTTGEYELSITPMFAFEVFHGAALSMSDSNADLSISIGLFLGSSVASNLHVQWNCFNLLAWHVQPRGDSFGQQSFHHVAIISYSVMSTFTCISSRASFKIEGSNHGRLQLYVILPLNKGKRFSRKWEAAAGINWWLLCISDTTIVGRPVLTTSAL